MMVFSVWESMCRCLLTASCLGFFYFKKGEILDCKRAASEYQSLYNVNSSPRVVPDLFKLTVTSHNAIAFVRFSGTSARFPHEWIWITHIVYCVISWYINPPQKSYIYIHIHSLAWCTKLKISEKEIKKLLLITLI